MHFLKPAFLLLLLLVPVVWFWPRGAGALHKALRSLVIAALAVALARPLTTVSEDEPHFVFVTDVSASTSDVGRAQSLLAATIPSLPANAHVSHVQVGSGLVVRALARGEVPQLKASEPGGESSLSAALAAADREIPGDSPGAVVLVTDGLTTDRRFGPAMLRLEERGIPVHTVQLAARGRDVYPAALRTSGTLRRGQTARVEVDVVGAAPALSVRLRSGSEVLKSAENLSSTGRITVPLEFEPGEEGFLSLTAEVVAATAENSDTTNDAITRSVAVDPPLSVLYLGERTKGGAEELGRLVGPGFAIEPADPAKLDGPTLARADLVLVDDLPAASFPKPSQDALADAVSNSGIGFLMAGGNAAFGPGGYSETPVASILPVDFVQKEEKRDPSTTLVVVIDTSGSMMGTRMVLAKEITRLAIRRLLPHDKVGICEFYGAKRWAAPIQPASNSIDIQRALNRLDAGGGTVLMPGLEEAYYALQNTQTRYKHVLVITDAGIEHGAFESMLRRMTEKGITVSTVLTGPEAHSEILVNMATWGKGHFYGCPDRFNLPEIILKQPTSARLPAYLRGSFGVRGRAGRSWLEEIVPERAPPLSGYVECKARDGCEVVIETEKGHPLVASWRYGLGQVSTFMTEPTAGGTEPWRGWPDYGRLMARILRKTSRGGHAPFEFTIAREDDLITVTARQLVPGDLTPAAEILPESGGKAAPLPFTRRAADLWVATAYADPAREVRVQASAIGDPTGTRSNLVSSAREDVSHETQVDPLRALDLSQVAAATGGRAMTVSTASSFVPQVGGGAAARRAAALWPWLFGLALVAYLLDILARRWPVRRIVTPS